MKLILVFLLYLRGCWVFGEVCTTNSGTVAKTCDYGCCDDDCCSEPFWTWYVIIGIAVAVIVGLLFFVSICIMLCIYCKKKKNRRTPIRRTRINTVEPSAPPYSLIMHDGMHQPPSYHQQYMEPPPTYYEAQNQLPRGVPKPHPSAGMPSLSTRSRLTQ